MVLLAAFFLVFLVYPLWHVVQGSLVANGSFTLEGFRLALRNDVIRESIGNSLLLAVLVTVLSTLIALPLAQLFVGYRFRGKGVAQGILLMALVMPPFVAAIGIRQLLARFGSFNLALMKLGIISEPIDFLGTQPFLAVVLMATLHLYPILFLNLMAALAGIDPALEEAAESMGANRWTRFFRIRLPLVLPGYFAGAIIVFIFAFTDLGTPLVFDLRDVVPVRIFERSTEEGSRDPAGYALVVIVMLLTLSLFVAGRLMLRRSGGNLASKGHGAATERDVPKRWQPLMYLGLFVLAVITLLPHVSIALVAFSEKWFFTVLPEQFSLTHFERVLTDEIAYFGVRNSLIYAGLSTAIDLVLGVLIAWLVVRAGGRLGGVFDALAMLPLAIPGIVLAFGYAAGFQGTFLDPLRDPTLLLVFGYAMRRLPYVARSADAGFRQVPPVLEEAAKNLGASGLTTLRRITVPLLAASLLAGGLIAFSFAMLEVSESLILAPTKEDYPIAKAIYLLMGDIFNGPQVASAMGVIGIVILVYCLTAAGRLLGRNLGQLFRA